MNVPFSWEKLGGYLAIVRDQSDEQTRNGPTSTTARGMPKLIRT